MQLFTSLLLFVEKHQGTEDSMLLAVTSDWMSASLIDLDLDLDLDLDPLPRILHVRIDRNPSGVRSCDTSRAWLHIVCRR